VRLFLAPPVAFHINTTPQQKITYGSITLQHIEYDDMETPASGLRLIINCPLSRTNGATMDFGGGLFIPWPGIIFAAVVIIVMILNTSRS
jgi:hypothetical protein